MQLQKCIPALTLSAILFLSLQGCNPDTTEDLTTATSEEIADDCANPGLVDAPVEITQYVATAEDFGCMQTAATTDEDPALRWYAVRNFLIKNHAGRTQEALDVACGRKAAPYPTGTIVQLIPFEAMVKRGGDFAPDANGWEFFALSSEEQDGQTVTKIVERGQTETVNFANANCYDCHRKARPEFDLLCEQTNGCDPLGIPASAIKEFQNADDRCPAP